MAIKGIKGVCPGCGKSKMLYQRRICGSCYMRPEIRARFARLYKFITPAAIGERNALIMDAHQTPPILLTTLARRIASIFKGVIDPEDLVQEAYLILIHNASNWLTEDTHSIRTYVHSCYRAIKRAMYEYAKREIQTVSIDFMEDEFYPKNELRGGTNHSWSLPYSLQGWDALDIAVTHHAVKKYRERFNKSGTTGDIRRHLGNSQVGSEEVTSVAKQAARSVIDSTFVNGDMVFCVLSDTVYRGIRRPVLASVLHMDIISHNLEAAKQYTLTYGRALQTRG